MNENTKQVIEDNILMSIETLKKDMLSRKEIKGLRIEETLEKITSLTFERIEHQDNNEISIDEVRKVINEEFKYKEFMINDYETQEKIRKNFSKAVTEMEESIDKYRKKLIYSLTNINNIYENIREFVLRELNDLMNNDKIFDESDLFQYDKIASLDVTSITMVHIVTKEEMLEINKKRLKHNYESAKYLVSEALNKVKRYEAYTTKMYPVFKSTSNRNDSTYKVEYKGQIIESKDLKYIARYNRMYLSTMSKTVYDSKDLGNYTLYQDYNINNETKEALLNLGCYTITLLGEHHNDVIEKIMFMIYPKLKYVKARKVYYNQYETQVMTIEQIIDAVQFLVYEHKNKNCALLLDVTSDLDARLTHIYQVLPKLTSIFSELTNNNKIRIIDEPVYIIRLPELVLNGSDTEYCNRVLEVADKCNIQAYARLKGFDYYKYFYIEIKKEIREVVDKALIEKDRTIAKMKLFNQGMDSINNDWVTSNIEKDIIRQLLIDKEVVKVTGISL